LGDEISAMAPDRRTGDYRSHTKLVVQENQGPQQMNHEYVAHIWLTASEEYAVFMPSEDYD
jgi:hypothetical protein